MKHAFNRNSIFAFFVVIVMLLSAMALSISAMTPAEDIILTKAVYGVPEKIDGVLDVAWEKAIVNENERFYPAYETSETELAVKWRAMYDNVYLYFFVEVVDSTLGDAEFEFDGWGNYYEKNSIHMMFDMGYERAASYDANDFYIDISCQGYYNGRGAGTTDVIKHAVVLTDDGYNVEVRLDHTAFPEFKAEEGTCFGFDVWGNDCLAPIPGRLYFKTWADEGTQSWKNPLAMGTIQLLEIPAGVTPTVKEEVEPRVPGDVEEEPITTIMPNGISNIEAEDWMNGGPGVAFEDDDYTEDGTYQHPRAPRPSNDSKLVPQTRFVGDGNYIVTHMNEPDWMAYKINVTEAGTYHFSAMCGSNWDGGTISFYLDDNETAIATISASELPSFNWSLALAQGGYAELPAGEHILKVAVSGPFDLDYIQIKPYNAAGDGDDDTTETNPADQGTVPNEDTTDETEDDTTTNNDTTNNDTTNNDTTNNDTTNNDTTTTPDTNKSEPNEGEFPWWILVIVAVVLGAGVVIVLGMKKKK